jgi:hypothetical protein
MSFIAASLIRSGSPPPRPRGFDHRLALVPIGMHVNDIYLTPTVSAIFLVDQVCASQVLNDLAFVEYLSRRMPVLLCASRARDLRPFLRRADAFRMRGFVLEVLQ